MKFIYNAIPVIFLTFSFNFAESDSTIVVNVNKLVAAVDDTISRGEYKTLKMEEISDVEGSPATLQFFFKSDKLISVIVTTGHEAWTSEYRYYYYSNEMPMKYLHIIKDRPDNPPRRGVIFDGKGSIVWKNTETKVDPFYLSKLFKTIQDIRLKFSVY
jgi:hypothetical protein